MNTQHAITLYFLKLSLDPVTRYQLYAKSHFVTVTNKPPKRSFLVVKYHIINM